jgi:DNA-binding beta-propeller fold protein YncE
MPHRRTRLLAALAALGAFTALPGAPAQAQAPAACPGGGDPCPYTTVTQSGQRGGGILRFPQAIAIGPDGAVYVGDQGSHIIQQFAPDGTWLRDIGTAGTRPGELTGTGSLAVAGDGSLLVADGGTNGVVRFDTTGGLIGSWRPGPDLGPFRFGPGRGNDGAAGGGLAAAGGTVYVADTGNDRVLRFDLDGGRGTQIVAPGQLANPRGVAVRGTRMLVADDQHHRLAVFDTGGRFLTSVGLGQGAGAGQLNFPYDVDMDTAGRVYVADDLNHRVVRFSTPPTGYRYKARWGSYGTAPGQLAYPRGIATDAAGDVYVTNTGNDRVDVFDGTGKLERSFGASGRAPGQFNAPLGVGVDGSGFRAVADSVNGRVQLLAPDGSLAAVWGSPNPGPTVLLRPIAVVFDAAGTPFVLDQRRNRIQVFDRTTGLPTRSIGFTGSGPGQMLSPTAMAIDGAGTLTVADAGNGRLIRFAADGSYLGSTIIGGTLRGVAVTPDGSRTYVATTANRITILDATGRVVKQFGGTGNRLGRLSAPGQITLDTAGNLWVVDRGNNRVQQFTADGQPLLAVGARGIGQGELLHPTGVSVDCNGNLTVTDSDNNRIQTFALTQLPAAACVPLPAPGSPPALKYPTLPEPLGPVLAVRVLRQSGVLGARSLPIRVGCDTTCRLTVSGTLTLRGQPAKGHKPVAIALKVPARTVMAGSSRVIRLPVSRRDAARLRRALGRRVGLSATIQLQATASAGEPTSQTLRISPTA